MIVGVLTLWYPEKIPFDKIAIDPKSALYLLAIVVGYFYHRSELRKELIIKRHWTRTDDYIRDRMLDLLQPPLLARARTLPKDTIKQIFWNLVDNDKSLTLKSEDIRWNGVFASSAADLAIFSAVFGFLHLVLFVFSVSPKAHMYWAIGCVITAIFSERVVVPWLVSRHIRLQEDQFNYVKTNLDDEVQEKILKVL
jgi:hypothetical protein